MENLWGSFLKGGNLRNIMSSLPQDQNVYPIQAVFLSRGAIDIIGHYISILAVLIRVFQETEPIGCMSVHTYIYIHVERGLCKEVGKSKTWTMSW